MDTKKNIMKIEPNQFMIYEELILSGQVDLTDVPALLAENSDFEAWYRQRAVTRQTSQKTKR